MSRLFKRLSVAFLATFTLFASGLSVAQANLDIDSPGISALRKSMQARSPQLSGYFVSGAVGFTKEGLIAVRDASAVPLPKRAEANQLVADENKDRTTLYKEIARANGNPQWENDIKNTFAQTWNKKAPAGWYYQDDKGAWVKK